MTEDDKRKLKAELFAGEELSPEFEIPYVQAQLKQHRANVDSIKADFLMFAETNDEDGLSKCRPAMKSNRDRIKYLEARLKELQG